MFKKLMVTTCILLTLNLHAEVITDGTLGRIETLSGNFTITEDLGQQMGGNLFHSFHTFNIDTGESAIFTGPNSISNIITRVTGGTKSSINGVLISDIEGANLYLLNPSGILFGENASLNITGSFHASTAEILHLEDGGRFAVGDPNNSLLTVAQPSAFGFWNNEPGTITIKGSFLKVIEKQEISMISGDLFLNDGTLLAPNGRVNLASVASKGEVIPTSSDLLITSFEKLGKTTLSQSVWPTPQEVEMYGPPPANIDVSGKNGAGQIFIRAGQFFLNNAWMFADNYGNKNGLIDVFVDGNMHLTNTTKITAGNFGMDQQSGFITITTESSLFIGLTTKELNKILEKNGVPSHAIPEVIKDRGFQKTFFSMIGTGNFHAGIGNDIRITTPELEVSYGFIEAFTLGRGKAGKIQIDAQHINLHDYGYINAAIGYDPHFIESGLGEAGDIAISATDGIYLSDFSSISVSSDPDTKGNAGNIYLNTPNLTLNTGQINSFSAGEGDAGSINITTDALLMTDKSGIFTEADLAGGGDINIDVHDRFYITNSEMSAKAFGKKNQDKGGNITIGTPAIFTLDNSQLLASAYAGNGGKIDIRTSKFNILGDRSRIDVSSELGLNGQLVLNSTKLRDEQLLLSPYQILPIPELSPNRCAGLSRENLSSFFVITRDVPPEAPGDLKTH